MIKEKYNNHLIIITPENDRELKFAYSLDLVGKIVECTEWVFNSSDDALTAAKAAIDQRIEYRKK